MEAILGSVIIFGGISSCCLYNCCFRNYQQLPATNGVIVTNALREEWGQPTAPTEKK